MIYYHVTLDSRLPKIKQEGLVIGKKRLWNNSFGVKLGDRKAIYLFSDFTMAIRWAHKMQWEFKKPISILRIKLDGNLDLDDHPEAGMNGGTSWHKYYENIPPSKIIDILPLTVELTRAAVAAVRDNSRVEPPPINEDIERLKVLAGLSTFQPKPLD